jgi:L-threonylcarbamoyladenylate synthase
MLPKESIVKAVEILKKGGLILHPTDTVWGIGCDPFNEEAVMRVQKLKNRPEDLPFILLVHSIEKLREYVPKIHPRVETLLSLHQRPLTIVYPDVLEFEPPLTNEAGEAAIRIVKTGFCHAILESYDQPMLSTSANIHGNPTPSFFGEITSDIIKGCDFTFPCDKNEKNGREQVPSVIATYNEKNGELEFIRS